MSRVRRVAGHPRIRQLARYGAVSIIATTTSAVVLVTLVLTRTLPAAWANVVATAVGTVPSFELNRRWVWGKTGQRSLAAEVGPFVALSFAGLGLSTLAVAAADHVANGAHLGSLARTCVVEGASLAAFGSLWLAQFAILDRLLFASRRGRAVASLDARRSQRSRAAHPSRGLASRSGPARVDQDGLVEAGPSCGAPRRRTPAIVGMASRGEG
ncbi:MAG: hypothetical protein JWN46_2429 [Acidimicrobiales bacterium]|nr:hypothetical protein [Acidimicrobiales bacterium]